MSDRPWAHPRVGGENPLASTWRRAPAGSSPRGRGKLTPYPRTSAILGLIPAWAGKTCNPPVPHCVAPAHPRVGGENLFTSHPA